MVKGTYAIYYDGHSESVPLKELAFDDPSGNSPKRGSFMEKMYYPRQPNSAAAHRARLGHEGPVGGR